MCVALQTRATTPRYSCTTTSDASLARSISPLSGLDLVGRFRIRRVDDDHTVKIDVHFSIDDRLPWQHLRRRIPRPLLDDAILNRFCDQSSNLFTLQRDEPLLAIVLVKLRTIIQSMDPRVISFKNEKVFPSKKNIVLRGDFLFQGGERNTKLFGRWTDDRSSL